MADLVYKLENIVESGRKYGGMAGAKLGIILNNENWIVKFPKSTKGFNTVEISYTTSPISEYIGSHIYETIGIDVHTTELGIKDNKAVVLCKDFRKANEEFYEFREIKNDYIEGLEEKIEKLTSSSSKGKTDIDEIILIMENNPTFKKQPKLIDRFWDMFVVDSLIGNNDRNNGNWGILVNTETKEIKVAPVYDNGASFNNSVSEERLKIILEDPNRFLNSVYNSTTSAFTKNDKIINPLKYIEEIRNAELNKAVLRVIPNVNIQKINNVIDSIPKEYDNIKILSDIQKEFYKKTVEYRYNNVLLPVYGKLIKIIDNNKDNVQFENNNDEEDEMK